MKKIIKLIIFAAILLFVTHFIERKNNLPKASYDDPLTTVESAKGLDEIMIHYTAMDISFNPTLHIPNWVAWELTENETDGKIDRKQTFSPDENIRGCATHKDYNNSGYSRGHMLPAADVKWSKKAMNESFYTTNVCPQHKNLNNKAWKKLEEKCRVWAEIDSDLIIVCGPILTDEITEYIGKTKVAVPKRFFKVILSPYANPPRGIGFIMPNGDVPGGMQGSAVSIDLVEEITGHNFFVNLPDEIENEVEAQCKFNQWSSLKKSQ